MNIFNSEMHLLTFLFVLAESVFFVFQVVYFLLYPKDKNRLYFLILLFLLIVYNTFGGLFPDPAINIDIVLQNILAYSSGFLMACYLPFYFYKAFELKSIRFHALYGIWLFIFLPFLLFIVIEYSITHDLTTSVQHAVYIPFFYAIFFILKLLKAIKNKYSTDINSSNSEVILTYFAILPWVTLPIVSYFQLAQYIEVLLTNSGFVVITFLFCRKNMITSWENERKLLYADENSTLYHLKQDFFLDNCQFYKFTPRETEIACLMRSGQTHKAIAEELFISETTVKKHAQNIYKKADVSNKFSLVSKLEAENKDL